MTKRRRVIVHIAASADGYIARADGNLDWLTSRPAPEGFYGMNAFMKTVDVSLMGRKTFEEGLRLGAQFGPNNRAIVFSRQPAPPELPDGVQWVNGPVRPFVEELRQQKGKNIWMMGGGELIAAFLEDGLIDEFVISVVPVFIGEGIPLIARHNMEVQMTLMSVERFDDGLVQLHYLLS